MPDIDRSDTFDDPERQIADLKRQIRERERGARTASAERRYAIGWWIYGAHKHIARLGRAAAAQREGQHIFMIHESDGDHVWGLCSCGARIPGMLHDDYTLAEFPTLAGHLPFEEGG